MPTFAFFCQTGKVVVLEDNLHLDKYPDFMQNKDWPSYKSETIIGKLFRKLKVGFPTVILLCHCLPSIPH